MTPDHIDSPTKAEFAHDAAAQLAYILGALGLPGDHNATTALLAALESGSSLKCAAAVLAECLQTVKLAIRTNVEDSKVVSRDRDTAQSDRDTARAGRKILAAELRRTDRDLANTKGLLCDALADNRELATSRDFWKAKGNRTALDPDTLGGFPDRFPDVDIPDDTAKEA